MIGRQKDPRTDIAIQGEEAGIGTLEAGIEILGAETGIPGIGRGGEEGARINGR